MPANRPKFIQQIDELRGQAEEINCLQKDSTAFGDIWQPNIAGERAVLGGDKKEFRIKKRIHAQANGLRLLL